MVQISPTLSVMLKAAEKAAKSLLRDFNEVENLQVSMKGPGDFVSNADKRSEEIIIKDLQKARPDYAILAEESGAKTAQNNSEYRFVIDPLDGTNNFLHSFPYWSISIGLEKNGEIIAGVVSVPTLNEVYYAEKGNGAYAQNGRRLRVSSRTKLSDAYIASASPSSVRRTANAPISTMDALNKFSSKVAHVRCVNSAALDLAYVAAGKFDALFDSCLKKWDIAAGIIILKEAGGMVTDLSGGNTYYETGNILATNYGLHDSLIGLLSVPK
jgi:myo-inositol-1(or 4)-monophosphatase